jgi:hypothetical protein
MKTLSRTDLDGMECVALFSDDEAYRLELIWRWAADLPLLVVWMLNPSTATHEVLDPTVYGLIQRARRLGYGGVRIINLFALRATKPEVMKAHAEPIGAENDEVIRRALIEARDAGSPVLAAWGKHGRHLDREAAALAIADELGVELFVLRFNLDGTPQHPLYIGREVGLSPWTRE